MLDDRRVPCCILPEQGDRLESASSWCKQRFPSSFREGTHFVFFTSKSSPWWHINPIASGPPGPMVSMKDRGPGALFAASAVGMENLWHSTEQRSLSQSENMGQQFFSKDVEKTHGKHIYKERPVEGKGIKRYGKDVQCEKRIKAKQ